MDEDKVKSYDKALEHLRDGAEHNGMTVDAARLQEMKEMVQRDVDHAMERHPSHHLIQVLENFKQMLAYHQGDTVVIDDADFSLLKEHLPTASFAEELSQQKLVSA